MTITLRPDIEVELAARAQAEGLSTEEFVNRELDHLITRTPQSSNLTGTERARLWNEWLNSHDAVELPPLSDESV